MIGVGRAPQPQTITSRAVLLFAVFGSGSAGRHRRPGPRRWCVIESRDDGDTHPCTLPGERGWGYTSLGLRGGNQNSPLPWRPPPPPHPSAPHRLASAAVQKASLEAATCADRVTCWPLDRLAWTVQSAHQVLAGESPAPRDTAVIGRVAATSRVMRQGPLGFRPVTIVQSAQQVQSAYVGSDLKRGLAKHLAALIP